MSKKIKLDFYNLIELREQSLRYLNKRFIPAHVVFRHLWRDVIALPIIDTKAVVLKDKISDGLVKLQNLNFITVFCLCSR